MQQPGQPPASTATRQFKVQEHGGHTFIHLLMRAKLSTLSIFNLDPCLPCCLLFRVVTVGSRLAWLGTLSHWTLGLGTGDGGQQTSRDLPGSRPGYPAAVRAFIVLCRV